MTSVRRFVIAATAGMLCVGLAATFAVAEKGETSEKGEKAEKAEGGEKKLTRAAMPKAVIAAFVAAYPKATMKGFGSETEDGVLFYEVESVYAGTHRDILYRADGSVVEIEEGVAIKNLPGAVSAAVAKLAPGAKVTGAEKITKGDVTAYEVHLKQGGKASELVLNAAGEQVKL
jgi:uncharacterized membrane protein YkoI